MRFEKWQALGNDYLIVERDALPWPLAPAIVTAVCDRHTGPGGDGVLELAPSQNADRVAELRIFNPDGSEAELSGNGSREALLYLRHAGWTDADRYSIGTLAGTITARIIDARSCAVAMGAATVRSSDFPNGGADGTGTVAGRPFQFIQIGNPQCAIRIADRATLDALELAAIGPPIENDPQFPNRTNVSFWCPTGPDRIRARIFERGVGETRSSGTGSCGAAVAATIAGLSSPVTVELDGGELHVAIASDGQIELTGWAEPVYAGRLSDELVARLGKLAGA